MVDVRPCETCGREAEVFVYSLAGIPMSVGNCNTCLAHSAYPLWVAEANTEVIGGLGYAADWWKESLTFKDGRYMTVAEAVEPVRG